MTMPQVVAASANSRPTIEGALATIASFIRGHEVQPDVEDALRCLETYVDKPLKIGEVKKRLGVKSPTTIHKWVDLGRFPNAYHVGGQLRIPAGDVFVVQQAGRRAEALALMSGPQPVGEFAGDPLEELL